jgi:branched-subunit amino acid transport protein
LSPVVSAALRFVESCIGTALAVLAVLVTPETVERQT